MASVTSVNLFDLLGQEEDGNIKVVPKQKEQKPKAAATTTAAKKTDAVKSGDRPKRAQGTRGPRTAEGADAAPGEERANRGKPAHGRRPRQVGRGREFDRHSATGRTDSKKAEEAGWGKATENLEQATEGAAAETEGEAPKTPEAVEEPEDNEKTLDQYYAELASKSLNISAKEVRKAGEGVDDSKWKNSTALEKDDDDFFVGKGIPSKARKAKAAAQKVHVDIEQRFTEAQRPGRRGERRDDRRPRNNQRRAPTVNVNDQSAFPTLGGN
ncbi:hypothetical protein CONCODRAFT_77395 [Conidiobolus coronatus NRRL 28638]|uniref:Hyaluronan/mRNA-binding protein domain-containing protein n=1 Tax=Conidiobolus coronatus (strain ATCC 28846 / CBS 209.66 / NRRL 28638) TaxID=796925 RepID=A0A137PEA5_CONC2|nr:hypothetical protein CONCODRAFT_77395 [Conidiobolus coronatus NRRL 28638]|eukprot:KXN73344.1 hypothetical protein CONCODRAFT_77395 [Conidiobolus coronatus NRRL 28638]